MNFIDIIVIYFACGAPFGVYHFINTRKKSSSPLLESLLVTILWIPYSLKLLYVRISKRTTASKFIEAEFMTLDEEAKLTFLKKDFENLLVNESTNYSLFEIREIIDRYSGLTIAAMNKNGFPAEHEREVFRISGMSENNISSVCLNRRNHKRLLFHQSEARKDFLKILEVFNNSGKNVKKLSTCSFEFVKLLKDGEAEVALRKTLPASSQTHGNSTVHFRG